MADTQSGSNPGRFEVRVTADTHFGWLRTRLSIERTLLSWVRSAVSLIGFGFAIVQFFERLQQMSQARPALVPDAPQYLGLALIGCGVLALIVAIWQYLWVVKYIRSGSFAPIAGIENARMPIAAIATAVLLIVIGLSAFFAVLFRLA